MEKTKEEFVTFLRQALNDKESDSFAQLYQFLVKCFVRADTDMDGKVNAEEFDSMIEESAKLPRMYGFAPTASDMYPSEDARKEARTKMFTDMNTSKDGFITIEQWLRFSVKHIEGKVNTLPKDCLGGADVSKDEFICFIKKAVDKSTPEYRELYFFLLKCFTDADEDRDGAVNVVEFDKMIEEAAAAPRKVGLAPSTKMMFKKDADRLAARKGYFKQMDVNNDGTISFDEWLNYAITHIMGKVTKLDEKSTKSSSKENAKPVKDKSTSVCALL